MSNKNWRTIHKWTAIAVGIFILIWTITGILMTIPARVFQPKPLSPPAAADFSTASLSPVQAIDNLSTATGREVVVRDMGMKQVQDHLVYWIVSADGLSMVDAKTGELVEIDPIMAERIARSAASSDSDILSNEILTSHDAVYPFGALPVYRIKFVENPSTFLYVNKNTGEVSQSTSITRIMAALISLHTFEPVNLFFEQDRYRKGLLIILSLVGVVTAITGYYLAVLPYLRRRSGKKAANGS